MKQLTNKEFVYITPLLVIITYLSAFEKGKPTCKRYLFNVFLYLITSLSVYIATTSLPDGIIPVEKFGLFLHLLILCGLFFMLHKIKNQFLKHIILLCILIYLGYITKEYYELFEAEDINFAIIQTFILLCIGSAIAYFKPQVFTEKRHSLLIGTLFISFISMLFDYAINRKRRIIWSYLFVIIFFLFIMFDMKTVFIHSKTCSSSKPPDYINQSLDIFLDVINIVNNLLLIND